jgi:hypothetical protein
MLQLSMNFFQYKTDIITKTWNLGLFHLNLPGEGGMLKRMSLPLFAV